MLKLSTVFTMESLSGMPHLIERVSSSARTLPPLDGHELSVVRSSGPYLLADDGQRYVDTAMGFGATMLGHADPHVVRAAAEALANGPLPAFSHPGEERAAAALGRRARSAVRRPGTRAGERGRATARHRPNLRW